MLIKKKPQKTKLLIIAASLVILAAFVIASWQFLIPEGWSQDTIFDDGNMNMRVQFKVEPNEPTVGSLVLMAKVKDVSGFPMRVDHVHFALSKSGQLIDQEIEAEPVGGFKAAGNGMYTANVYIESPGVYEANLQVAHGTSSFKASWLIEVKQ